MRILAYYHRTFFCILSSDCTVLARCGVLAKLSHFKRALGVLEITIIRFVFFFWRIL